MNFRRLEILSNEIEVINAIMSNKVAVSFNLLFDGQDDLSKEHKLDKICEILYKSFKTVQDIDETNIQRMFEEYYNNSEIGAFCIEFIKMNLELDQLSLEEKIEKLSKMNSDCLPNAQIKIDHLQMLVSLLLNQSPLNMELINQYNNKLKTLLADVEAQNNEE